MATSSETSDQNQVKSRRPAESAFKQQRLPAWQPILTAGTVLPTFFVIGIAFIPVGIGLLYFSDEVKEHVMDYTYCPKKGQNISCAEYIKQTNQTATCECEMNFNLTEDFKADVYFYYGLSNYYQNHRRYVKSRDDNQLLGRLNQPPSSDCEPFAHADVNGVKKPIAPCGAIANSLFNDTLSLYSVDLSLDVPVHRTGIAWKSDKEIKFRNPEGPELKIAFQNYTKPSNWAKDVWDLDPEIPENNGFQNEDLIVWMRTAALPTFRKLYRRVNHERDGFRKGLSKGAYVLNIKYNYPVTDFEGTKSFIISTTSLLGGKNPFLGVAYVVVGTVCLLLGIVLLIIHVRCSKRYYPSPTDSFFWDIDTHPRVTGSEAVRAISNAFTSQAATNEKSTANVSKNEDDTDKSPHIDRTSKLTDISRERSKEKVDSAENPPSVNDYDAKIPSSFIEAMKAHDQSSLRAVSTMESREKADMKMKEFADKKPSNEKGIGPMAEIKEKVVADINPKTEAGKFKGNITNVTETKEKQAIAMNSKEIATETLPKPGTTSTALDTYNLSIQNEYSQEPPIKTHDLPKIKIRQGRITK